MNIPEASVFSIVQVKRPDAPNYGFTLYKIEDHKGFFLLVRRSKRTTAAPSEKGNVIAVFPQGDDSVVFGEFTPAETTENCKVLTEYGLALAKV